MLLFRVCLLAWSLKFRSKLDSAGQNLGTTFTRKNIHYFFSSFLPLCESRENMDFLDLLERKATEENR